MSRSDTNPKDVLSAQELLWLRFAQEIYGAKAKEAAAGLAEALGLDEKARGQLIGGLVFKLEGRDFEERSRIAEDFRRLTIALGGTAVEGAIPTTISPDVVIGQSEGTLQDINPTIGFPDDSLPSPELSPQDIPSSTPPTQPEGILPEEPKTVSENETDESLEGVAGLTEATTEVIWVRNEDEEHREPEASLAKILDDELALNKEQISWLRKIFDDEMVETITQMTNEQHSVLVSALVQKYQTMRINRLQSAGRQRRIKIMQAFMAHASYKETAQTLGIQPNALLKDLDSIAYNFKKRAFPGELVKLVLSIKGASQTPQPEASGKLRAPNTPQEEDNEVLPKELNTIQERWIGKVYKNKEALKSIEDLTPTQRDYFAQRLGRHINSAVIRSQGVAKTARRLQEVSLLIKGSSYDEIAEIVRTDVDTVKKELHHSAHRLKDTTPTPTLDKILADASLLKEE